MANEELDYEESKKLLSFHFSYNKRNIKMTWVVALVIIVNFLLEEYFGGSKNTSVLVRMGANVNEKVLAGEHYRLFSSVFLHAGFLHVFFNTYVLFALGGFFNRILGASRYLAVLLFSGICGSLSSVYLSKAGISVGASGAIWGLFGASLALSIFKTSLLPEPIRLNLRRITLINVVINLGISFLPMIDFWAHIGGGIGGFLLGLLVVLTSQSEKSYHLSSYFFRLFSLVLAAFYTAAIIYGFWLYTPWQDQMKAPLVKVSLSAVPFDIEVPKGLSEAKLPNNTATSAHYIFGEPGLDSLAVEIHFFKQDILGDEVKDSKWLSRKRDELLQEKSLTPEVKKTVYYKDTIDGGILYYQQIIKNSAMLVHNYLIMRDNYVIRISLLLSDSISQAAADSLANQIMASLKFKRG